MQPGEELLASGLWIRVTPSFWQAAKVLHNVIHSGPSESARQARPATVRWLGLARSDQKRLSHNQKRLPTKRNLARLKPGECSDPA